MADIINIIPWAGLAAILVASVGLGKFLIDQFATYQTLQDQIDEERERRRKLEDDFQKNKNDCKNQMLKMEYKAEERIREIVREYERKLAGLRALLDEANRRIVELESKNGD